MEMFLNAVEQISNFAGVFSAIVSVMIWLSLRQNETVIVNLTNKGQVVFTIEIPHKTFSRAELLGRLGMFSSRDRFSVASMSDPAILVAIDGATDSRVGYMEIELRDDEVSQFM